MLKAVDAKNQAGQKITLSDFDSPIQSEYAGKFSDQSNDWNYFL
jgi:hypothetical protein